jgi:hypothetical protein
MCAAAWTDKQLNQILLAGILNERRRAVASSPGVDLVMVLRHAIAAHRRRIATDIFIATTLAITLALSIVAAVVTSRPLAPPGPVAPEDVPTTPTTPVTLIALVALVALIAAGTAVFLENFTIYYRVLARTLRRNVFDPANAPTFRQEVERRLAEIQARDLGNVTVFPDYSPFIGHGGLVTAWSFVLNVAKPAEGKTVTAFSIEEVYDYVAKQVRSLGQGVAVENRVLVYGEDLLDGIDSVVGRAILPHDLEAPRPSIDDRLVRQLMSDPQGRARTYLSIRVIGWGGELALTVFLRFTMPRLQELLFVEASYLLLTPVQARYRLVDRLLPHPPISQLIQLAAKSAAQTPLRIITSIGTSIGSLLSRASGPAWDRTEHYDTTLIRHYKSFNYGAIVSARELVGDNVYFRYFQELDKAMYAATVERRIFDAVSDFLESHGVDVAELTNRQTTILNNGIFVAGRGTVNAQNIAAGQDSRAQTITPTPSNTAAGK